MPHRPSRIFVADATARGGVAIGLVVLALTSGGPQPDAASTPPVSPAATVREFLDDALVDHDPVAACELLAPAERARVGGERGCEAAVSALARRPFAPRAVAAHGGDVAVEGLGTRVVLRLEPLPPSRRPRELASESGWRIASGAERLLR